jgi:hypothetical protein
MAVKQAKKTKVEVAKEVPAEETKVTETPTVIKGPAVKNVEVSSLTTEELTEQFAKLEQCNMMLRHKVDEQERQYAALAAQTAEIITHSKEVQEANKLLLVQVEKIQEIAEKAKENAANQASSSSEGNKWIVPTIVGVGAAAATAGLMYVLLSD